MTETTLDDIQELAAELDNGYETLTRIGLIILSSDHTIEQEWHQILPRDHVAVYHTRITNSPEITPETLSAMKDGLMDTSARLMPGEKLDAIAYGCTSASTVIGPDEVAAQINLSKPDTPITTPITAMLAGFEALGCKKIALLTPYSREVTNRMRSYLEGAGMQIVRTSSFFEPDDNRVARISEHSIKNAARSLGQDAGVEGVFVACTNLRVARVIAPLEAELGKPVLSSNVAMAWHALRLAGNTTQLPGLGRLLETC